MDYTSIATQDFAHTRGNIMSKTLNTIGNRIWWLVNEADIDMCEMFITLASFVWLVVLASGATSAMTPAIINVMSVVWWGLMGGFLTTSHFLGWVYKINWLRSLSATIAAGWWIFIAVIAFRHHIYLMAGWCVMFSVFSALACWRIGNGRECIHP